VTAETETGRRGSLGRAVGRLPAELARAGHELAGSWGRQAWIATVAAVALAAVPLVVGDLRVRTLAAALYVVLAVVGLNVAVGLAGLPSLGQAGFVGIGAFATAWLRARAGWDVAPALACGTALAAAAGALVGWGAVRLSPTFVAVTTWVFTWLAALGLAAFPVVFGGARGLVVPAGSVGLPGTNVVVELTPTVHYELGLLLVALALIGFAAVRRGASGLALAAARQGAAEAMAVGISPARRQLRAFAVAAAIGGLAGALGVQLAGVADPTAFGPVLSVELFVAVLLGGEGTVFGPVLGSLVLALAPLLGRRAGSLAGVTPERFEPVIAGALLVLALVVARRLRAARPDWFDPRRLRRADTEAAGETPPELHRPRARGSLQGRGLAVEFGGVVAVEDLDIDVAPGEIHALIGPNGSGKTTCLRILAGTVPPDRGRVVLDGTDLLDLGPDRRAAAGVVRTLPGIAVFGDLPVADHVAAGATSGRRFGGALRTVLATPKARAEDRAFRARARGVVRWSGLEAKANRRAGTLSAPDQRLVMLATACAAEPSYLLLDEPSAGMSRPEIERVAGLLRDLRGRGVGILLVEHNVGLVRRVADRVTVLDAGRVVAAGSPEEIARDPKVIEVYLGTPRRDDL
jgi:branched-chain amino acid transport system permease protein